MKFPLLIFSLLVLISCNNAESVNVIEDSTNTTQNISNEEYLVCWSNHNELLCLLNEEGDTIVPFGKYIMSYMDTIREMGIVLDTNDDWLGINKSDSLLFKVYNFDPGSDYISEGLFRIIKDDKIGFANEKGEIIIQTIYSCAYPFEEGSAKVSLEHRISTENDPDDWEYMCNDWFYINHEGRKVKPGSLHPLPNQ